VVLEGLIRMAEGEVDPLRHTEARALQVLGIHGIVALTYTLWPKPAPADAE
jgi:hypothetical protein